MSDLSITIRVPYDDIVRFRSGLAALTRIGRNAGALKAVTDVDDLIDLFIDATDTQLAGIGDLEAEQLSGYGPS